MIACQIKVGNNIPELKDFVNLDHAINHVKQLAFKNEGERITLDYHKEFIFDRTILNNPKNENS